VGLFPQAALTRGPGNADVVEVRTDLAGRYAFARLAPGRYLVGMNLQTDLKGLPVLPRIFYPGVSAASAARPFDLARGQRVELGDFRIPASMRLATIRGTAVIAQDRPAAGATIYLYGEDSARSPLLAAPAVADTAGRFAFTVTAGARYSLVAQL